MALHRNIIQHITYFGCDPEIFFAKAGKIIGAEKVFDDKGLDTGGGKSRTGDELGATIVLDGVQAEFNPSPQPCRANLANEIAMAFRTLKKHLESVEGVQASFKSVVEVDKAELKTLSDKARILGCQPSFNLYDKDATIKVDPKTYRKRSAGGHIHIGLCADKWGDYGTHLFPHRIELVPILDYIVGNTSVLVDRDPDAAERRKVYGRASEHRLPNHGLEYRVLSNFWLKSYPLMSMVFGLTRMAVSILGTKYSHTLPDVPKPGQLLFKDNRLDKDWDPVAELLASADKDAIQEAINTNNVELAKKNWVGIKKFIMEHNGSNFTGLVPSNIPIFEHFIKRIDEKGLEYWFKEDPMEHWTTMPEAHNKFGWENFLSYIVNQDLQNEKKGVTNDAAVRLPRIDPQGPGVTVGTP